MSNIEEYINLCLEAVPDLMELNGLELKVLICCWKAAYYPSSATKYNIVYNSPSFKQLCVETGLNTSPASIDNAISALTKAGMLIRLHKGEYALNPRYFIKELPYNCTTIKPK